MNEIFYEFKEEKEEAHLSSEKRIEIILHFLSKVDEYIVLYETTLTINKPSTSNIDEEVIKAIQKVIAEVNSDIRLVKGKIREIFLSYSS